MWKKYNRVCPEESKKKKEFKFSPSKITTPVNAENTEQDQIKISGKENSKRVEDPVMQISIKSVATHICKIIFE